MPYSERQRRAACADLNRVKRHGEARTFHDASLRQLNDLCAGPLKTARRGGTVKGRKRKRSSRY